MHTKKNDKKYIHAWAMYDWANSVYNLIITTTFFPVYYIAVTSDAFKGDLVPFFGMQFINSVLYDYAIAFAFLIVLFLTPLLSTFADIYQNKLLFLKIFSLIGSVSCAALFFFEGQNIEFGIVFFVLAAIGYAGSLVFYNSFLPEIASPDKQDTVSAKGYMYGYVGSIIVQIIGFVILLTHPFGLSDGEAIRVTFLIVGIWWFVFAQYSTSVLKHIPIQKKQVQYAVSKAIANSYQTLLIVGKKMIATQQIAPFLSAFFFYNMGVQTVMIVAINFGQKILHIPSSNLILTAVAIQLIAIVGALFMAQLAKRIGNINTIILVVILWIGICIGAYFITQAIHFYILAVLVGFVMGGIQSISRSTFSKLMPTGVDTTSYFSFYDVVEKATIILGIFVFGFIESITHSMRYSVLSLIVFFTIGLYFLLRMIWRNKKPISISTNSI